MSLIQDLEQVVSKVLPADPSFRAVDREMVDVCVRDARRNALLNRKDEFLLSLMRLMALPGNGHSRLIPNDAISILPLRLATIGTKVRLLDASSNFLSAVGGELMSINGVSTGEIERASRKFLAGTRQRQRVIGPILFVWPAALKNFGIPSSHGAFRYQIADGEGRTIELQLSSTKVVNGSVFYPLNEHGRTDAAWSPREYLMIKDFGSSGVLMSLPSFFDPSKAALSDAIAKATELAKVRSDIPLVLDIRGNTGGDFLRTLPLIDAISQGNKNRKMAVLVDKFSFSAAIVFVALLKYRIGRRLMIIGEEMGDGLTFFAEGETIKLPLSGAQVRYSSAFHDWASGRIDETTPEEVARKIVPVGTLEIDRNWTANPIGANELDLFYRDVLDSLSV
ncbi:peptidase S41 [Ruegeria sp. R13_0]|uniref:peptidase S41 n=1 Tax=Ruegeria sp. R13_0 TaxID=2821099 RepID=UPI001ADBFB0F|nr:peptidase S41 [Ruegeria sp. R13_0]MBO9434726.1 peptidase S41 [Ruegeria sp. R13_0]